MSQPSSENILAERHYVTLILRLSMDSHGRLIQGELVDMANEIQERFMGRAGLTRAVQDWLTKQEQADGDTDT